MLETECEDGNLIDLDGCSSKCLIEAGYTCKGTPSICNKCGDGKLLFGETCDAGLEKGCLSNCMGEMDGYDCVSGNETSPSICTISLQAQ